MNQLGPDIDKRLNEISRQIGEAETIIETQTQVKDAAWQRAFDFFDEFNRGGKDARFIADDGYTLYRQERQGQPKLDANMLQALIFQRYSKVEATRIWNSITERSVDNTKLEAAVRSQKLDPALVEQCITAPTTTYARIRREWTKEDKERAKIHGIERKGI